MVPEDTKFPRKDATFALARVLKLKLAPGEFPFVFPRENAASADFGPKHSSECESSVLARVLKLAIS